MSTMPAAHQASMFVCELTTQHNSTPSGTPSGLAQTGMGTSLVAMFAMVAFWPIAVIALRSLRRLNWLIQRPFDSFQLQLTTPPPR